MPTNKFTKRHFFFILLILIIGAYSLKILLQPGFPQGHDTIWHTERITSMFTELRNGQFPVRWVTDLDNSYGVPLFNFVYPGPYYLGAFGMFLGLGSVAMLKLLTVFFYLSGGIGTYLIFRKQPSIGLITSLIYLFTPYQFVNIFVRQAFGEVAALGLIPWAILAVKDLEEMKVLRWYHPIPLALALISHNFLGIFAVGIIILYTLISSQKESQIKSILLSIGLAAFFLIPMIFERQYLYSVSAGEFSFDYQDHFVYPKQLLYSKWDYWYSVPGDGDLMTFQLGLTNIIATLLAIGSLILFKAKSAKFKSINREIVLLLAVTLGSILLMIPAGRFIWQLIPLLQVMQFPWRMLAITVISTSLLAGLALQAISKKQKLLVYLIGVFLISLAFVNTRNYHTPIRVLSDEEYLTLHLQNVNKTATSIRSEIVPKWSIHDRIAPSNSQFPGSRIAVYEGDIEILDANDNGNDTSFSVVSASDEASVIIYRNYFPSWQATKDNLPITLSPNEGGDIIVPLARGEHLYRVYVGSTTIQKIANVISLTALLSLFVIARRKNGK